MSDRNRSTGKATKKTAKVDPKPTTKAKPTPAPKKAPKAKAATPQPEVTTQEPETIEQPTATTELPTTAIDTPPTDTAIEPTPATIEQPTTPPAEQTPMEVKQPDVAPVIAMPTTPRKLSALDAAAQVLATAPEPMTTKELVQAMSSLGLWTSPGGKTPHATLYSAILREITTKGIASRFRKTARGRFAHTSN